MRPARHPQVTFWSEDPISNPSFCIHLPTYCLLMMLLGAESWKKFFLPSPAKITLGGLLGRKCSFREVSYQNFIYFEFFRKRIPQNCKVYDKIWNSTCFVGSFDFSRFFAILKLKKIFFQSSYFFQNENQNFLQSSELSRFWKIFPDFTDFPIFPWKILIFFSFLWKIIFLSKTISKKGKNPKKNFIEISQKQNLWFEDSITINQGLELSRFSQIFRGIFFDQKFSHIFFEKIFLNSSYHCWTLS